MSSPPINYPPLLAKDAALPSPAAYARRQPIAMPAGKAAGPQPADKAAAESSPDKLVPAKAAAPGGRPAVPPGRADGTDPLLRPAPPAAPDPLYNVLRAAALGRPRGR